MSAVQIVSSSWFMPGYIGLLIGGCAGAAIVLATQWVMNR